MGSGVALFDYDNDERLDISAVTVHIAAADSACCNTHQHFAWAGLRNRYAGQFKVVNCDSTRAFI